MFPVPCKYFQLSYKYSQLYVLVAQWHNSNANHLSLWLDYFEILIWLQKQLELEEGQQGKGVWS